MKVSEHIIRQALKQSLLVRREGKKITIETLRFIHVNTCYSLGMHARKRNEQNR